MTFTAAVGRANIVRTTVPDRAITVSREPHHDAVRAEARRLAGHRVAFFGHALAWAGVGLLLLVVAGFRAAVIVALAWGIGLAAHGYFAVLAPRYRRMWTEEEVSQRLAGAATPERLSTEERHARSLEELAASIAHEIRNPITAAKSLLQQITEDPSSADNPEYARVALDELDRVERSVSHLLRYARDEEVRFEQVDLSDVVAAALGALSDRIAKSKARVERDADFEAKLRGDPEKLRRVVMNLVDNALDALDDAGDAADPHVRVSSGRSLAGDQVWLRVKDNGPGIDPALLPRIWSPFFTSKKRGTGLGLAITKKLVDAHGGTIEVTSSRPGGTELVATFPAARAGDP